MTALAYAHLLRWLGPWAAADRAPKDVERSTIAIAASRPFEAWVYRPRRRKIAGAYLLTPGLHYDGPADPRFDRFARILANAGMLVVAPFLPDFAALQVEDAVIGDLERAFDALLGQPDLPKHIAPGVFSISFGSLPALRLGARPEVGALVIFGGYADYARTVRFCLGADASGPPRDPLNGPVVWMNLVDDLDPSVRAAWLRFVKSTWGRPEMKARERYEPVARAIADTLDAEQRHLFLMGCGLAPGAAERCEAALRRQVDERPFLDPRPHLAGIRCPVHLVHGIDDDVIPASQLDELMRAMPKGLDVSTYLTGLYGHTGASRTDLRSLGREVGTLLRLLHALVMAGATPRR